MGNSPLLVPQGAAQSLHCSHGLIREDEETDAALLSPAPSLVPLWRPRYPVFQALRKMDLAALLETSPHGETKRPEKRDGDNVASFYSLEKLECPSRCKDIPLNWRSEPEAVDKARGFVPPGYEETELIAAGFREKGRNPGGAHIFRPAPVVRHRGGTSILRLVRHPRRTLRTAGRAAPLIFPPTA